MAKWLGERPYWIPLLLAVVVAAAGWSADRATRAAARTEIASKLQTILGAQAAALDVWLSTQRASARDLADDPELEALVARLRDRFRHEGRAGLLEAPEQAALEAIVGPVVERHRYVAWRVYDADLVCLAASDVAVVGRVARGDPAETARVHAGETFVTPPLALETEELTTAPQGVMAVFTPVEGAEGRAIGSLALGIDAASTFSRLLEAERLGETGETYAFSREGRMLSPSRFEPALRRAGLLPGDPRVGAFMRVEVRDPGGDVTAGFVPDLPLLARPLTRMAASAVAGGSGMDLDGYRDYRGVMVVGAWRWLPVPGLGIATEIDRREAYAAVAPVRTRIGGLVGLLAVAALGMGLYGRAIRRVQGDLAAARRLGRYELEALVGQGGMGAVYRARHALLRRPTAVKVLRREHTSRESVARFEREVQVTSELTHPNTIDIYDFGRTRGGLFYYAMEYLDGATLRAVVDRAGPLPDARVLPILRALCGSIAEAHRRGMIHRDIKPSNVMLCDRGGLLDYVKVLDFGLVKPLDAGPEEALTDVRSLTGTPLYMPPETIRSADAAGPASDVYQIGAVAWFLLAGRHVFAGSGAVEVLEQHLNAEPARPSAAAGVTIDPALEAIVMRCLAKEPAARPPDAGALLAELEAIALDTQWSRADAERFWRDWRPEPAGEASRPRAEMPVRVGEALDMAPRDSRDV